MRIGWVVHSASFDIASVRYRCHYVAYGLSLRGDHVSSIFESDAAAMAALDRLDVLVVVKRVDQAMLALVSAARERGVAVIFDLCDDVISRGYRGDNPLLNNFIAAGLIAATEVVVTTGPALSARIQAAIPIPISFAEIPDVVETPHLIARTREFLVQIGRRDLAIDEPAAGPGRVARRQARTFRQWMWAVRNHPRLRGVKRGASRTLHILRHPSQWRARLGRAWRRSPLGARVRNYAARARYQVTHPRHACRRAWALLTESGPPLNRPTRDSVAKPTPIPAPLLPAAEAVVTPGEVAPRVVWFGNHGAPHSNFGLLSLVGVGGVLRRVHADHPFELVVISSNWSKYLAFIPRLGVPARYVEWSTEAVHRELAGARAALLTSGDDEFSEVKSANRAALALAAGVPVISPMTRALEPLAGVIATNVEEGLRRYLTDREAAAADVEASVAKLEAAFGLDEVVRRWRGVLAQARKSMEARRAVRWMAPKVCVLIDLVQDLEVLLPVIDECRRRQIRVNVVVSTSGAQQLPRIVEALIQRQITPTSFGPSDKMDARWLRDSDVLITAAETSMSAHKVAHTLTAIANRHGLRTATVQHGFEAPALTYHGDGEAEVAAQVIFTWQAPETLPVATPAGVRRRCVGVGRPRLKAQAAALTPDADVRPAIGVFENLHWTRYDRGYRHRFVETLDLVAERRPDLRFVVRPHPAGRWFLGAAPRLHSANVVVQSPETDGPPLSAFAAVITTPSTVAVDACEVGVSTAIVANDLKDLDAYAPLPLLRSVDDWLRFLHSALDHEGANSAAEFHRRAVQPGDAAAAIIDFMTRPDWPPADQPAVSELEAAHSASR